MGLKKREVILENGRPFIYTGPSVSGISQPLRYIQSTETSGHPFLNGRGAKTDLGGNFSTFQISYENSTDDVITTPVKLGQSYRGPSWPANPISAIQLAVADNFVNEQKLITMGSTAVARSLPTNPVFDAGTFLGELKEGLPKAIGRDLLKSKFKDYRKVGGEYLNIEFGWKPIVSDIQKFGKAAIESQKILEQLERDSGKNIRRKFTFPRDTTTTVSKNTNAYAYTGGGYSRSWCYGGPGTLTTTTQTDVDTWFSGCFTYHLNLGNTLRDRMDRTAAEARKLYGVELTPATVWNLAPWSWAVDWEGNIGDVLHNISRFSQDGLVMRYGYVMQRKTVTRTYLLSGGLLLGSPARNLQMTVTSTVKVRRKATPFGFGFDMSALTGRQSAILGALGISRSPRR